MISGRSIVCNSSVSGSGRVTVVDDVNHVLGIMSKFLFKTNYLNSSIAVFLNGQLLLSVEQVTRFTTVNLEETHVELESLWL